MAIKWHSIDAPLCFEITLDAPAGESSQSLAIRLEQIYRVLPGKRIVGLVDFCGQRAVAKLFFAPGRWRQHLQRERDGIQQMQLKQIATAAVVGYGNFSGLQLAENQSLSGGLLLLEYLPGSSLGDCWRKADEAQVKTLLQQEALRLIATCHHEGLVQHDIHLSNFHVSGEQQYLLDAADVQALAPGPEQALDNLALFLAQFPARDNNWIMSQSRYYAEQRARLGAGCMPALDDMPARVHKARQARWRVVERKLFRETSTHACYKNWHRFVVYDRALESSALQDFIERPNVVIDRGRILKAGNSATVAAIDINGSEYIVKRYNLKGPLHFLRRMFRPSRAWVSWRNAHMLQMFGLDTARPWLMMERRAGPLRREAYFLAEAVAGTDALRSLCGEPANGAAWQDALPRFCELFRVMRQYQIVHGDMKATNFITSHGRLAVLDLDAMRMELDSARFSRDWQRDLDRFLKNWESNPSLHKSLSASLESCLSAPKH